MQKRLIFLSMLLCSCLVYLSENTSTHPSLEVEAVSTKHSILLDLNTKTDKVIYDNLIFSNYSCTLNKKQAVCSQYHSLQQLNSSNSNHSNLYSVKTQKGDNLEIYSLPTGEVRVDYRLEETKTLHRYSFTSIENINLLKSHKDLFEKTLSPSLRKNL